jgi:hypothetical protein
MKTKNTTVAVFLVGLALQTSVAFAGNIELAPGASAKIAPGESTTVSCGGAYSLPACELRPIGINGQYYDVVVSNNRMESSVKLDEALNL